MTRCRCGHSADVHQHFRVGSDCSRCHCRAYLPVTVAPPPRGPMAIVVASILNSMRARRQARRERRTK